LFKKRYNEIVLRLPIKIKPKIFDHQTILKKYQ